MISGYLCFSPVKHVLNRIGFQIDINSVLHWNDVFLQSISKAKALNPMSYKLRTRESYALIRKLLS